MRLKLPPTLAFPSREEVPKGYDIDLLDARRAAAQIEPGYVLSPADGDKPFAFYARCNVDTDQLWDAFEAFSGDLPDVVGTILGFKDERPKVLPYSARADVVAQLRLYRRELTRDPFLECGLIHQAAGRTEEVFVTAAKYFRVWGNDVVRFKATAGRLGLDEIADLRFVDEFPLTSHALRFVEPDALHFTDVLEDLCDRLNELASGPASL